MSWFILGLLAVLFVLHHGVYPKLLHWVSARRRVKSPEVISESALPRMAILMPAYNEGASITDKLHNLLALDYPVEKLEIYLLLDGCTDNTKACVMALKPAFDEQLINMHVIENLKNQGKVAGVNKLIRATRGKADISVFTDVSALLSVDSLKIIAAGMQVARTGVISGDYRLFEAGDDGESKYWKYQRDLRRAEGRMGAVIGVPGALYAARTHLLRPLEADTINDDFILPMRVVQQGYDAVVDSRIQIVEMESSSSNMDFKRRVRIGAGNLQQLGRLIPMLSPRYGWVAVNFFFGKGLRALMPGILVFQLGLLMAMAISGDSWASGLVVAEVIGGALTLGCYHKGIRLPVLTALGYLINGYLAAVIGQGEYLLRGKQKPWEKVTDS